MQKCQFCLENNTLKGKILTQNELCYFVESIDPILKYAGMIIPKRHIETPFELDKKEWESMKNMLEEVKKIFDEHHPDGYNIGFNVGIVGGQNVPHTHLHVIARFADEPLSGKGIRHALKQQSNRRPNN